MKYIKKSEAISFTNSPTCSGFAYDLEDKDIDIATTLVHGRYPETGRVMNETSKEVAYVLSGTGTVTVDSKELPLAAGDAVIIQPGEKFFWQGDQLEMLMPCSPAFDPNQHKEVE